MTVRLHLPSVGVGAAVALVLAALTAFAGPDRQSAGPSGAWQPVGRYQMNCTNESVYVIDTTTGDTWFRNYNNTSRTRYLSSFTPGPTGER